MKKLQFVEPQKALYRTMHNSHPGYRHVNQGIKVACDWLHLLRDRRGEVHNPWTDTPIKVIELGCGNGILCKLLSTMGFDVTGTDLYEGKVIYDRTAYKFLEQDLTKVPYPFKDNEFDYCLSFDVLEHLPEKDIGAVLAEMARISRGIIVKVSCHGIKPLHITVKSPGWWLNQLTTYCPDFSWQLLRNVERIAKDDGRKGATLDKASDIRPFKGGEKITYAPLFHGKRGVIDEG
jgi:SAM-dependent methyltransferase